MCGFAGFFKKNDLTQTDTDLIEKMSESIKHRGPDDSQTVIDAGFGAGFRRLSIIDLEKGVQPFTHKSNRYIGIFNGEIYNYLTLRSELATKGVSFETRSEIETLIELYIHDGVGFISRLRGMFAVAIYDKEEKKLFLGRDPFGIKPLYYKTTDDGTTFASELKAFEYSCDKNKHLTVDKNALQQYLTFQYVPEPDTAFSEVKILPAGHYVLFSAGETPVPTRYCEYRFKPNFHIGFDEKEKKLRCALENSVKAHMLSDVPVGTFLSSGIDSAVITALASKLSPGIKAFTVSFDVKEYSEADDASEIAKNLNVEHIVRFADFEDFANAYEKTIYHLDGPVADPSAVAVYLICEEAAKHVKVVLSGEGSDELFGGYRVYGSSRSAQKIYSLPNGVKNVVKSFASILPDSVKGKGLLLRGTIPVEERFAGNAFIFDEKEKKRLYKHYNPDVSFIDVTRPVYANVSEMSMLTKMQYCDINTWLKGDILVKCDRMSMAHSLEARVPFLDREVFEAASVLCDDDKLSCGTTKYIFRHAFSDLVDEKTFMRPKKGYPVPVRLWLKNELYDWAKNIIVSPECEELFDKNACLKMLEDHRLGKADNYRTLWTVLTLSSWYKMHSK